MMVPARGITGGMSKGVWYFGMSVGWSVPPGICAVARCTQPNWVATYHPTVDAPVSLMKSRRVSIAKSSLPFRARVPSPVIAILPTR